MAVLVHRCAQRGLLIIALLAIIASATLPALAADLRPEVAAVRGALDQADLAQQEARARQATADSALLGRSGERDVAATALAEAAARHQVAVAEREQAEARAAEVADAARAAARRRDLAGHRLLASVERRGAHQEQLRALVVEAWKQGGDTARITGVAAALTSSSRDVGTTFAAIDRLELGADRTGAHLAVSTATVIADGTERDRLAQLADAAAAASQRADSTVHERLAVESEHLAERTTAEIQLASAVARVVAAEEERIVAGSAVDEAVAAGVAARGTAEAIRHLAGAPGPDRLSWPTDGTVNSGFGLRRHPVLADVRLHRGVDIPAATGQVVLAAGDGVVVAAGDRGGYGLAVEVDHGGGLRTLSTHLSRIDVQTGQRVGVTQRIGAVGSTGLSTGPHLHFEVHVGGQAVDPFRYFRP